MLENKQAYGSFVADPIAMQVHHLEEIQPGQWPAKAWRDFISYLSTSISPTANPGLLEPFCSPLRDGLLEFLPEEPAYGFKGAEQLQDVRRVSTFTVPDSDTVGFGLLPVLLAGTGLAVAFFLPAGTEKFLYFLGIVSVVLFFAAFSFFHLWFPYAYRYFILALPWIALSSVIALRFIGRVHPSLPIAILVLQATILPDIFSGSYNTGYRSLPDKPNPLRANIFRPAVRNLLEDLPRDQAIATGLPNNAYFDAFYRQPTGHDVTQFDLELLGKYRDIEAFLEMHPRFSGIFIDPRFPVIRRGRSEFIPIQLSTLKKNANTLLYAVRTSGSPPKGHYFIENIALLDDAWVIDLKVLPPDLAEVHLLLENTISFPFTVLFVANGTIRETLNLPGHAELRHPLEPPQASEWRLVFKAAAPARVDPRESLFPEFNFEELHAPVFP